jgi:hypothetical protein
VRKLGLLHDMVHEADAQGFVGIDGPRVKMSSLDIGAPTRRGSWLAPTDRP